MNIETGVTERLRKIIGEKGLKQKYVAERAGLTDKQFNSLLCGKKVFRVNYIPPIAAALGVSMNDIFSDIYTSVAETTAQKHI